MKKRRIVITGLGPVTPNGLGIDDYWGNIKKGNSGIGPITSFDVSTLPITYAGEIDDNQIDLKRFIKSRKQLKFLSRNALFAMIGASLAIEDSGLSFQQLNPERIGVYLGTSYGQRDMEEKGDLLLVAESEIVPGDRDTQKYAAAFIKNINPVHMLQSLTNLVACNIAIAHNTKGPVNTFVTNCTAGAQAIGNAYRTIKRGDADIMIAGGTEATIYPQHLMDCAIFLPMSTGKDELPHRACRPFDARRKGMVLSEGAGILILEDLDHAIKRGAKIYGEMLGHSTSSGHIHFARRKNEKSIALAMENALFEAGIKKPDVDYLNANGDSTILTDKLETLAIKKTFGKSSYQLPISSTKSMTGHLTAASPAVEIITCFLAMRDNVIPPTINYEYPDLDCDLDYVPNRARPSEVQVAMSNSIGWFGQSSSLVVRRFAQ